MDITQNKFAFFSNFKEVANKLNDEMRLKFYDAITDYVFYEKEPEDVMISALITALKPSLDKEDTRGGHRDGAGRKPNQKESNEIKNNQKESKLIKANQNNQSFLETETRNKKQETETEIKINSSDEPKYAFEGKIVKLNQKNFDEWKKAYPNLNLYAELLQRDRWLQKQPEDAHKNWFMSTSQYFIKQDALRKAQNSELAEQYGQQKASNDDVCWF